MRCCLIEREVGHGVGWNDVQMAMGYFESSNDEPNPIVFIELFLRQSNPFCDNHEMCRNLG